MPFDGTDFGSYAAILRAARDGIADPERWCQGMRDDGPAHCVEGWLAEVMPKSAAAWDIVDVVSKHLFPELPRPYRVAVFTDMQRAKKVVGWQDAPGRHHASVVAPFDRAIARLDAADA